MTFPPLTPSDWLRPAPTWCRSNTPSRPLVRRPGPVKTSPADRASLPACLFLPPPCLVRRPIRVAQPRAPLGSRHTPSHRRTLVRPRVADPQRWISRRPRGPGRRTCRPQPRRPNARRTAIESVAIADSRSWPPRILIRVVRQLGRFLTQSLWTSCLPISPSRSSRRARFTSSARISAVPVWKARHCWIIGTFFFFFFFPLC